MARGRSPNTFFWKLSFTLALPPPLTASQQEMLYIDADRAAEAAVWPQIWRPAVRTAPGGPEGLVGSSRFEKAPSSVFVPSSDARSP